jgi:hypothetical protein
MKNLEMAVLYALLYVNFSEACNVSSTEEVLDHLTCEHCIRKKARMCEGRGYHGEEALACIVEDFVGETGMAIGARSFLKNLGEQ